MKGSARDYMTTFVAICLVVASLWNLYEVLNTASDLYREG